MEDKKKAAKIAKRVNDQARKSAGLEKSVSASLLTDAFDDLYKRRFKVYKMNLIRGMMFGLGSVVGGTVLIALLIWVLSHLFDIPGGFGDFIRFVVNIIQNNPN